MMKLKTIALAAAASAGLLLAMPAGSGAAPLSPLTASAMEGVNPTVHVAKRKWKKQRYHARRADRRRAWSRKRVGHRHWHGRRHYAWGGHYRPRYYGAYYRPYYGYGHYRPYRYVYRPYCGYGYGWGYSNCYGYGAYGGPGINLIFRF